MSYCDDQYTKVPKPAAPSYTVNEKPAAPSYTVGVKPTASYTVEVKPTASYTIVGKGTRPTTYIIPQPCLELMAILTEHSIEITEEDTRVLVVEGALV